MTTTVEDIFRVPIQVLPDRLAPLPGLLRRAQSKSCSNASSVLDSKMVPSESPHAARVHNYLIFKESVLARARSNSPQAHSVVSQIIALLERVPIQSEGRMIVLGALSAKIDDIGFLITFRDQFSRP